MGLEGLFFGALFGAALYVAGAHLPSKIIGMLTFRDLSLMKNILFAIGMASFLVALFSSLGIFDPGHFSIKTMNLAVIIGGLIFGLGFGLGGTCPGTCVAALGGTDTWIKGLLAVLGAFVGAFVFNQVYSVFVSWGIFESLNLGKLTLFKISEDYESVLTIGTSGLYITGLLFMLIAIFVPRTIEKQVKA